MYNPYYYQGFQSYPQTYPQYQQPSYPQNSQTYQQPSLQGKLVDGLEAVKGIEFPLDGSVSYFPLTDGSAIVSKQLMNNGTSKMTIYKPVLGEETKPTEYLTKEDLENVLKGKYEPLNDIMEELKNIKTQLNKIKGKD